MLTIYESFDGANLPMKTTAANMKPKLLSSMKKILQDLMSVAKGLVYMTGQIFSFKKVISFL